MAQAVVASPTIEASDCVEFKLLQVVVEIARFEIRKINLNHG